MDTSTAPLGQNSPGSRLLEVAKVLLFLSHTNQQPSGLAQLPPACSKRHQRVTMVRDYNSGFESRLCNTPPPSTPSTLSMLSLA